MPRKPNKPKSRERAKRKRERPPSPMMQMALEHHRAGRLQRAVQLYETLVTQNPRHSEALHFLGTISMQQGNHRGAINFTLRALAIDPEHPSYHFTLGTCLFAVGELDQAIEALEQCVQLKSDFFQAYLNLADVLRAQHRFSDAVAYLNKALSLQPESNDALSRLGTTRRAAGDLASALVCFQQVVANNPHLADAHFDLADVLNRLGHTDEAVESYRAGLAINPANGHAHNNLGECLLSLCCHEDAIEALRESLRHHPSLVEAHNNLGLALAATDDPESALELFRKALELDKDFAPAHYNIGNTLATQTRLSEAIIAYQEAIRVDPHYPEAHNNLGGVFQAQGKLDEAESAYRRALKLQPQAAQTHSNLLFCVNYRDDVKAEEIFAMHRQWDAVHSLPRLPLSINNPNPERRLRIGYVSADFHQHSVAYFAEPVLAAHDKMNFDIVAYADVVGADVVTERLRRSVSEWRDISTLDHQRVAEVVRGDGIDILVDLSGHAGRNRLRVFSAKPAPIQVTYIGYPNTTGVASMDYRVSDALADPVGDTERYHVEELVRVDGGFLCYQPPPNTPDVSDPPALACGHITFGSFNNLSKVTAEVVRVWSAILHRVDRSRLLLKSPALADHNTRQRYADQFNAQGVALERLEFLARVEATTDHLALYDRIDIALDPFPYNGTTTTCEALWMGVPVVTMSGRLHAGRVGTSLLSSIGAKDWIAETEDCYIAKAADLASNLTELRHQRSRLRETMRSSELMNAPLFTRKLEDAYRKMWRRWCENA